VCLGELEAFRSLSGERDRLGSKDGMGMDCLGWVERMQILLRLFASKICPFWILDHKNIIESWDAQIC